MQEIYDRLNMIEVKKFEKINEIKNIYNDMKKYFSNGITQGEFESIEEFLKRKPNIFAGRGFLVEMDDSIYPKKNYSYDPDKQVISIPIPSGGGNNCMPIKAYESNSIPVIYALCASFNYLKAQGKGYIGYDKVLSFFIRREIARDIASFLRARIAFTIKYPASIGTYSHSEQYIYNPQSGGFSKRECEIRSVPIIIQYIEIYDFRNSKTVMRFVKKPGYKVNAYE